MSVIIKIIIIVAVVSQTQLSHWDKVMHKTLGALNLVVYLSCLAKVLVYECGQK